MEPSMPTPSLLQYALANAGEPVSYQARRPSCLTVPKRGGTLYVNGKEQRRGAHIHVSFGMTVLWVEHINDIPA